MERRKASYEERIARLQFGSLNPGEWIAIGRGLARAVGAAKSDPTAIVLEVGTLNAKTTKALHLALQLLGADRLVVTIDKDPSKDRVWSKMMDSLPEAAQARGVFCLGTSDDWVATGASAGIAFGFVDGCHCQECVAKDIANIAPKVIPGGELAFHDADDQRTRGMLVHERYHGNDGQARHYGVSEAIIEAERIGGLMGWELVQKVRARDRGKNAPTPIFGGLQVWRRPG